jgi:aryl-alcohol dehydrogenase-like predicted oxidoreductase
MPEPEATALFKGVYDAGCRHFDTAEVYRSFKTIGEAPTDETVYNESQLGAFFKTVPRDSFTVASKFMPIGKPDCSYETVKRALEASLARLGLDFVDLYYSHRVLSREQGIEFATACKRLKEEGLLRNVGLSEVSAADLRAAHAVTPICCIQQEWSLLTREPEEELVPVCKELNIGIVAYSPLARNLLTAPKTRPTDQRRSVIPRFDESNFEKNQEMMAKLEALAAQKSVSPAQLSMGWLLQKGNDLGVQLLPIPGTKTLSHALENIASAKIELAPDDMALLEEIAVLSAGARESDAYMEKGLEGNTKRAKESDLPITMSAVVCREGGATPYAPAKFEYEAAWPCPALGDLHRAFRDLPGPEDAEVLVQVAYSSMNPADRELLLCASLRLILCCHW